MTRLIPRQKTRVRWSRIACRNSSDLIRRLVNLGEPLGDAGELAQPVVGVGQVRDETAGGGSIHGVVAIGWRTKAT